MLHKACSENVLEDVKEHADYAVALATKNCEEDLLQTMLEIFSTNLFFATIHVMDIARKPIELNVTFSKNASPDRLLCPVEFAY